MPVIPKTRPVDKTQDAFVCIASDIFNSLYDRGEIKHDGQNKYKLDVFSKVPDDVTFNNVTVSGVLSAENAKICTIKGCYSEYYDAYLVSIVGDADPPDDKSALTVDFLHSKGAQFDGSVVCSSLKSLSTIIASSNIYSDGEIVGQFISLIDPLSTSSIQGSVEISGYSKFDGDVYANSNFEIGHGFEILDTALPAKLNFSKYCMYYSYLWW